MARDHARIHVTIWRNRGFRALTRDAQHLYFTIVSQPDLSYCGVLTWLPGRIAALSAGSTPDDVTQAAKELEAARFVRIDTDTAELAVRTYIKHDGVLHRVNMGKAAAAAIGRVTSLTLHDELLAELARLYAREPDHAGWRGLFEGLEPASADAIRAPARPHDHGMDDGNGME